MSDTKDNTITDLLEDRTYMACRKAGMPAKEALERAHYIRHIRTEYANWRLDLGEHFEDEEVWIRETPEGRYEVRYDVDELASLEDYDDDLYSAEARLAYKRGSGADWWHYNVTAAFIQKDRMTGTAGIGAVDAGDFFKTPTYPLSHDEQIFAVAIDFYKIHEDAKASAAEPEAEITPLPEEEENTYDPMNALGLAGFAWVYNEMECGMVFQRFVDGEPQYMTGDPITGGVNLCLHSSFFNRTLTSQHATADSFVQAFTETFDRLWDDYNGED